jgi:ATP-dependent DNA helicase RecG
MSDILNIEQRIRNTIQLGESHFREFKTALEGPPATKKPRPVKAILGDIAEAIVSFANADGGELLIGVEDDGTITGLSHSGEEISALQSNWTLYVQHDAARPGTLPAVTAAIIHLEGQRVLWFAISKGLSRIFQLSNGRCVRRRDKATEPADVNEMEFEKQESLSRAFDQQFVDGAGVADLDNGLVQSIAGTFLPGMSPELYLQQVGLAEYGPTGLRLRMAALLLFAKDIVRWHSRCEIRVLRVLGTELKTGAEYNVTSDEPRRGNIMQLLRLSWEALRPFLADKTRFGEDAKFDQQYLFPEAACREALTNAIAHRAYNIHNPVEIFVFDDRIEIKSPGSLLSTLTIRDLEDRNGAHESRNPLIARVLRENKYMRELGEGMKRIFELMEQSEHKAPALYSNSTWFSITLFNRLIYTPDQQQWLKSFVHLDLTPLEKRVILAGMGGRNLSRNDIVRAMKTDDRDTYDRTVTGLIVKKVLESTRSGAAARAHAKRSNKHPHDVPRFRVILPPPADLASPAIP